MASSKSFRFTGIVACFVMCVAGAALAEPECKASPDKWMKESDFKRHLRRKGYLVSNIKIAGGCYEFYGLDPLGRRILIRFDPETAQPAKLK